MTTTSALAAAAGRVAASPPAPPPAHTPASASAPAPAPATAAASLPTTAHAAPVSMSVDELLEELKNLDDEGKARARAALGEAEEPKAEDKKPDEPVAAMDPKRIIAVCTTHLGATPQRDAVAMAAISEGVRTETALLERIIGAVRSAPASDAGAAPIGGGRGAIPDQPRDKESAVAAYAAAVDAIVRTGKSRGEAVKEINRTQPELRAMAYGG